MEYLEVKISEEKGYILPISDLHIGSKQFTNKSMSLLQGYLNWVKEKNAKIVLVGDLFDCATRESKTSPFEVKDNEFQLAIDLFKPYKDYIICAIDGNHEQRLEDFANHNILNAFCHALGINYAKTSAVINFKINKRPDEKRYRQQYILYFHHSTGGGGNIGNKMNRVYKMTELLSDADAYIAGHNHQLGVMPIIRQYTNIRSKKIEKQKQYLIDAGSYLEWEGYPERGMLRPTKLGSVRIRLSGVKKDIHASI